MKIESDVNHLVTKPCPGLKQRRPNLSTHAPLTGITTSPPFELVSIDFLHLAQSSGGTNISLVTTSQDLHKPTRLASQTQLLLIAYNKTNYSTIWFPLENPSLSRLRVGEYTFPEIT